MDQKVTQFWLVRHGEPQGDIKGHCYGNLDVSLSAEGRRQIVRVAEHLSEAHLSAIYCSPRLRAKESARVIATRYSLPVTILEAFSEINFGSFEGLSYEEIERRYPSLYQQWMACPTEVEFPNGESFLAMRRRVCDAAQSLRRLHCGESIAIVSHGGVNRILLASALGMPSAHIFRLAQRYAAINKIVYIEDQPVVEIVNGSCD